MTTAERARAGDREGWPGPVAIDVSVQEVAEPTGVERAQAVLLDALLACDGGPRLLLASHARVPERWRGHPRVALAEGGGASSALPVTAWRQLALPRALRRGGAVLLHAPVAALPLRLPVPAVATVHEVPWAGGDGELGERGVRHRLALAHAARAAAALLCPSRRTADGVALLHGAARERLLVLPHPVDPRFSPGQGGALPPGVPAAEPFVLAVGRLRRKKNLLALLEACARLPGDGARPAARLVLAGPPGDASAELSERARRADLAGRVVFTGFVGDERLLALYRHAGVLAMPSLFEGFGLPVVEALACGTPVVAARQGALPEAAEGCVRLVDGEDVVALSAALAEALAGGPPTQALVVRGRAHAARLSPAAHAEGVLALWRRLLAGAPP